MILQTSGEKGPKIKSATPHQFLSEPILEKTKSGKKDSSSPRWKKNRKKIRKNKLKKSKTTWWKCAIMAKIVKMSSDTKMIWSGSNSANLKSCLSLKEATSHRRESRPTSRLTPLARSRAGLAPQRLRWTAVFSTKNLSSEIRFIA